MPLVFEFAEKHRDSRAISMDAESFDQEFSFFLWGNFYESADIDPVFGPDDDVVALEAAYTIIPQFRFMPGYDGFLVLLTLTNIKLTSLQADHWLVEVTYGIPNGGGQFPGGYEETVPPIEDSGNEWSNKYVQIGFETSVAEVTRTMSKMLLAKDASVWAGAVAPYTVGKGAPIGHHADGAEGGVAYEPTFTFNVTSYFTPSQLNYAYARRLFSMTGTINNRAFFGFAPGSVMFQGTSGQGDLFSIIPVTFNFEMKLNFFMSDTTSSQIIVPMTTPVPPAIPEETPPDQNGLPMMYRVINDPYFQSTLFSGEPWLEYNTNDWLFEAGGINANSLFSGWSQIDYRYGPEKPDPATGLMIQEPIFRFIHRVQDYSDFKRLRI
jgi:hypothetical protein